MTAALRTPTAEKSDWKPTACILCASATATSRSASGPRGHHGPGRPTSVPTAVRRCGPWARGIGRTRRRIPFVPWLVVPYWTLDLFFCATFFLCGTRAELRLLTTRLIVVVLASAAFYLIFPLKFGWERPEPAGWTAPKIKRISPAEDDPIIAEVRRVRHKISAEHGHDTQRLGKHYQELEKKLRKAGKAKFVTK